IVLAILSVIGGYIGLPPVISEHHVLNDFLSSSVTNIGNHAMEHSTEWMLLAVSTVIAIGFSLAGYMAFKNAVPADAKGFGKILEQKWYVDELYDRVIVKPLKMLSYQSDKLLERNVIDGGVNGIGK